MIPKTIHQIWIGPDDPPINWMQTWVDLAFESDFHYTVWNENTIPPLENYEAFNYFYERGEFAGAADIARVEILEQHGGWYVDADTELVDPLGFYYDPMHASSFVAVSHPDPKSSRVPNGVFAAIPGHRILSRMVSLQAGLWEDYLEGEGDMDPSWATVGGTAFSGAIHMVPKRHRPYFVEAKMFFPFHFGERTEGEGPTYAIHHQLSTRQREQWADLPEYEL